MGMTAKSGILLLMCCVSAIASVGSIFELSSGNPDLGNTNTILILIITIPLTVIFFWTAVMDTRANQ